MGIKKYIESPEVMWEHFLAYKSQVKKNPIIVKDWVGKDATDVYREKEKPLTFIGFQNYLDDQNIITDVTDYFENKDNRYNDFVRICSRIKRNIQEDQISGGMAGIYNQSITQRLNSLTDNVYNFQNLFCCKCFIHFINKKKQIKKQIPYFLLIKMLLLLLFTKLVRTTFISVCKAMNN